jgi:leader peptidase (prepilin peptidase) / N-methyltransferase
MAIGDDVCVTVVGWLWVAAVAVVGVGAAATVRAAVFHFGVPAGEPWRTRCPHCEVTIVRPGWGIIGSSLRANGRCPHCGRPIGPPVAVVELLAAAILGVLAWCAGFQVATIGLLWAALVALALALIDIAVHRLPDRLIAAALAGAALFFAAAAIASGDYRRLGIAVACGLGCGLVYFVIVFLTPRGMGLGDAKLAVLVGMTSGWFGTPTAILAIFVGILFAGLWAIGLLATRRVTRRDRIAYGPFMLLGALAAVILATI